MKFLNPSKGLVLTIVFVFTILQLATIFIFKYTPYPDSNGYIILAKECIAAGEPYPIMDKSSALPFIWNVGAINLVALSLWITGSVLPLMVFYAFLKGFSAFLVYSICKMLFKPSTAFICLLLYVFYPANYGEATCVQSELPFTFFILLGVYLSLRQHSMVGGAFLCFANWIRPMGIVFLLSLLLFVCMKRKYRSCIHLIAGYAVVFLLIGSFTYARTGYFITQAKTGWMALLQYSVDHSPYDDAYFTKADGLNAVQSDSLWRSNMIRWVQEYPSEYVKQMPHKFAATYVSDNVNLSAFLPNKEQRTYLYGELSILSLLHSFPNYTWVQWLTAYNLLYYYTLLFAFLVGCIILLRQRAYISLSLPLSVVFFGTMILLLVGHGEARFHGPLMPFILILSAVTIQHYYYNRWLRTKGS